MLSYRHLAWRMPMFYKSTLDHLHYHTAHPAISSAWGSWAMREEKPRTDRKPLLNLIIQWETVRGEELEMRGMERVKAVACPIAGGGWGCQEDRLNQDTWKVQIKTVNRVISEFRNILYFLFIILNTETASNHYLGSQFICLSNVISKNLLKLYN